MDLLDVQCFFPGSPESLMLRRESDSNLNMDWAVL